MVVIGSDHTGIELKNRIISHLKEKNIECLDVTNFKDQSGDDYPDDAVLISEAVKKNNCLGIAICGTGIGISIACNKVKGIRAAVCTTPYMAKLTRQDNNANILCLGARLDNICYMDIVDMFLTTSFSGGRHERRVEKIAKIETMKEE